MLGQAYIGTSGWNYKSWRKDFYGETPQNRWLRFCSQRFTGIEVNGTFYRLQEKSTFEKWRDQTPERFRFAIKGHRYVTHNKKLLDVEESVIRCRESVASLGKRLAALAATGISEKGHRPAGEVFRRSASLEKHPTRYRVSSQILVR